MIPLIKAIIASESRSFHSNLLNNRVNYKTKNTTL